MLTAQSMQEANGPASRLQRRVQAAPTGTLCVGMRGAQEGSWVPTLEVVYDGHGRETEGHLHDEPASGHRCLALRGSESTLTCTAPIKWLKPSHPPACRALASQLSPDKGFKDFADATDVCQEGMLAHLLVLARSFAGTGSHTSAKSQS